MIKSILKLVVFSALLALISFMIEFLGFSNLTHDLNLWIIIFLCVTSILIHFASDFLEKSLQLDFTLIWLGAVTARLLIALFSFLIVALIIKENLVLFAANFSAIYLSFLVFEIISVLSNLRRNSSLDRSND